MSIASIVLKGTAREFDRRYDYSVPESLEGKVLPGMRVMVPFGGGNGLKEGYVLDMVQESDYPTLKDIKKVVDKAPVLSADMLSLALWMKDRYICTYADALRCMLPAGTGLKSRRMVRLLKPAEGLGKNQQKLVDFLAERCEDCEDVEIREKADIKGFSACLRELSEKQVVSVWEEFSENVKDKFVRAAYLAMPEEEVQSDIDKNRLNRIQHIRVLEILMGNGPIPVADLARFAGVSPSVLDTLSKYGYLAFCNLEIKRDPFKHLAFERTEPHIPTREQEKVLEDVKGLVDSGTFSEVLLHGVTGSGKTEVYLQLIQHVIDAGRQAIVLVPEISLTPQMVERFKGRFGDYVAVQHSRLSLGERYDQWRLIKDGRIKVAVGARSAVFAPFDRLGVVIIDEEHENSYKSETMPKYHAAEVARKRCRDAGALLLSGSATPSVETYFKSEKGEIKRHELFERATGIKLPAVETVDMRLELEAGNRTPFSDRLSREIKANMAAHEQTILFLNRRGYASFVLCRSCGYVVKCRNCSISLTYHSNNERLVCHQCGYTERLPAICPKCSSQNIRHFGTGTQKVEEELKKHFPGCSVIRMDMDTTTGKNSHEEILTRFREQGIDILVGTQMIAKGHDFPRVTLVGVLAADSLLNIDDYRATERTFQLLTQVAGRAGRDVLPGRVVVQTYSTEDFSIQAACRHNYHEFYRQEIMTRERLGYPPFMQIGTIIISSQEDRLAFSTSKEVASRLEKAAADGIAVLGPLRAPLPKIQNRYRWRIIIKCPSEAELLGLLTSVSDSFRGIRGRRQVEMSVDINPVSML
ncbi:MAG: primosomal protein N' [Clostridiales bacterium]|nr:primosomal protein N' [Clostridiales bacterium]